MNGHATIALWVLLQMTRWASVNVPSVAWQEIAYREKPHLIETPEEKFQRFGEIAWAITTVAYDPDETPAFGGPWGRAKTAALLARVAFKEGGYHKDVDTGERAGDGGQSVCNMQVRFWKGAETTIEGWTKEDVAQDRLKCFREGLRRVRSSLVTCAKLLHEEDRLSAYTTGSCQDDEPFSQERFVLAMDLFSSAKTRPLRDERVRLLDAAENPRP